MLDEKDQTILELLKENADLSTYKIAKKTRIPQTTVLNRIKKLKKNKFIKRYTVDVDYKKFGKKVKALIFVKVDKKAESKKGIVGELDKEMLRHPPVISVKRLMGKNDFVMEVIAKDIEEINQFLIDKIRKLDEIAETETVIVLDEWYK